MGSLKPDGESKQELDDSGYVQDETAKPAVEQYRGTAELLDLSDDVLLYILRNCSPQDLKALGFTCPRLGTLILDRTLWVDVDARSAPNGRRRVRWLLSRALGPHTKRLKLRGYAQEADGCLGYVNRDMESEAADATFEERYLCGGPRVYRLTQTPTSGCGRAPPAARGACSGPRLTMSAGALAELAARCPALTSLDLDHCVIDCQTTHIGMFPRTLKRLSLRGTKCFNLESKSFLFKIQDYLCELEELDVSFCSWVEPACMLPLSKMPRLKSLAMQECHKLAEFVAYASLATRYGFKQLEHLDLRGSPVGDSEVSALGWLPRLSSLFLSPARAAPRPPDHAHYSQDFLPAVKELDDWEETEPEYFRPVLTPEQQVIQDADVVGAPERTTDQDEMDSDCGMLSVVWHRQNAARRPRLVTNPPECILLERMIAEPVNPDDYSRVYYQFLAGNERDVPIASPAEYRAAFNRYQVQPTPPHPPAGYSLLIRKPDRPGPSKPGTSREEAGPSTSQPEAGSSRPAEPSESQPDRPGSKRPAEKPTPQYDSDSSDTEAKKKDSDDDEPPTKKPCEAKGSKRPKAKKGSKKRKDPSQPRRVFEITINELNSGHNLANAVANDANAGSSQSSNDTGKATNSGNVASNDVTSNAENPSASGSLNNNGDGSIDTGNLSNNTSNGSTDPGNLSNNTGNASVDNGNSSINTVNGSIDLSNSSLNSGDVPNNAGNGSVESGINTANPPGNVANPVPNPAAGDPGANPDPGDHAIPDPSRRIFQFRQYRRPIVIEEFVNVVPEAGEAPSRGVLFPGCPNRLDPASLVSDSSIRRFGRAIGENINYIHIGGPMRDANARPDRSSLRVLSVVGFRLVTDASLIHLTSAAPLLERLILNGTAVTAAAAERFRALRPDVELILDDSST